MKAWRKKERKMEGTKKNEGKDSGNDFIIECKIPLWHIRALFLRLHGVWGGSWAFKYSSWYLYLMQFSVIIPANTESNVNYSLFPTIYFLCLFTLLYFMTFVNLSTGSKTATIFSSRKKNHHEFHLPLTKIKNILTPYRLFRFNYN